jgi:glycosyltransferase involved in cell wall biosynthesis
MDTRRINLLFIVNSLDFGGAEKHTISLLNYLDTARFRLSLAYLKSEKTLLSQLDLTRMEGRVFCCDVKKKIDFAAIRQLAATIRDDDIDIVVCVNNYSLLYGWLARVAARRKPRLVEVFHTTEMGSRKDTVQMFFYRPFFLVSDMLVYVCANQQKYWRARALRARSDTVIHNGIDVERFCDIYTNDEKNSLRESYGFQPSDYVVGLCALLRPEKAHLDLLRAIARLRAAEFEVKCLLIGDGPERPKIEAAIAAMGLDTHVRITGLISDVRVVVAACDVMALVSHSVETFSIAALEAMALGKPMIMTSIGGAAEQIAHGENGYLYERGDIAALSSALLQLMESSKRGQMGNLARTVVARQFSMETMVHAYDRLFVRLAASRV